MSGKQYPMSRAVIVLMLNSYRRAGDLDGLLATLEHTAKVGVHVPAEAYNVALSACLDRRRSDRFAAVAASVPRGRHDIVTCNLLMVHEIRRQNLERANEYFQMAISIYGTRYRQTPELDRAMDYTVQTLLFAHRKVRRRRGAPCVYSGGPTARAGPVALDACGDGRGQERNWDRIRSLYEQFRRVRLPMSATVRLEALLAYARLSDSHGFAECRRSLRYVWKQSGELNSRRARLTAGGRPLPWARPAAMRTLTCLSAARSIWRTCSCSRAPTTRQPPRRTGPPSCGRPCRRCPPPWKRCRRRGSPQPTVRAGSAAHPEERRTEP